MDTVSAPSRCAAATISCCCPGRQHHRSRGRQLVVGYRLEGTNYGFRTDAVYSAQQFDLTPRSAR